MVRIESHEDALGDTYFVVSSDSADGCVTKTLSYEQLCKMLVNSYKIEKESVHVGNVPGGYIDASIREDGGSVIVYVKGAVRAFYLNTGSKAPDTYIIPFPSLIFKVTFQKDGLSSGSVFAVKGEYDEVKESYYKENLLLYRYPFGNVSGDGHICMGNMRVCVPDMAHVHDFIEKFFDSITNSDYIGNSPVTTDGKSQGQLLSFLSGKGVFPDKLLVEHKSRGFKSLGLLI